MPESQKQSQKTHTKTLNPFVWTRKVFPFVVPNEGEESYITWESHLEILPPGIAQHPRALHNTKLPIYGIAALKKCTKEFSTESPEVGHRIAQWIKLCADDSLLSIQNLLEEIMPYHAENQGISHNTFSPELIDFIALCWCRRASLNSIGGKERK